MSLAVVVLLPNGRRQTVKVTPKFSIREILETVCRKQGLNSDDYELKHYKTILDLSSNVQFSNLCNNAQLELVKATSIRAKADKVNIGLQLEMGERLIADFPASATLWDMVNSWDITRGMIMSTAVEQGLVPVCVYMRREIVGQEALAQTTLRNLGLVGGKAMIRLLFRQAEMLKQQAHCEVPLARIAKLPESDDEGVTQDVKTPSPARISQAIAAGHDNRRQMAAEATPRRAEDLLTKLKRTVSQQVPRRPRRDDNAGSVSENEIARGGSPEKVAHEPMDVVPHADAMDEGQVFILGDRHAMVFSLDSVQSQTRGNVHEELPDDFYDLTINDIHYLHEDLVRQRIDAEKQPQELALLQAQTLQKKFERYKRTVIRVQFPDRLILQGLFDSTETVGDVMDFVRKYVSNEAADFYLFTAPPKELLPSAKQLFSASLVPKAVVYFGSNAPIERPLKDEILSMLSSISGANLAASSVGQTAKGDSNQNDVMGSC